MDFVDVSSYQAVIAAVGLVVVSAGWWFLTRNKYKIDEIPVDLNKQSVPYKGDQNVRASPVMLDEPLKYFFEDVRTLHDVFLRGVKLSGGLPCLGWRPSLDANYQWITYQQVLDRSQQFGSGLIAQGAAANPSQFIGIFAQNRVEWKIAEQACNSFSMVVVPLYDTLGPQSIRHIINQCKLQIVIVDKLIKAKGLIAGAQDGKFYITHIIVMDKLSDDIKSLGQDAKITVLKFSEVEELGAADLQEFVPPQSDDLHTICYTSGTTGLPKGAMLTHGNFVANAAGVFCLGSNSFLKMDQDDVHLSYLPLAHVFERIIQAQLFFSGSRIGYFQGDVKLLMDDVGILRPTVFPMVPRLINRLYDKINSMAAKSMIKKFLMNRGYQSKLALLKKGIVTRSCFWDKVVFHKIQSMLGGRVRICITGAAPISMDVINFMRCALGVNFSEGYGQTEATAAITFSLPGDFMSGSVGTPTPCNIIKLVDVPEKNYFAKNGKGEVCAKGANIFTGYYKDETKTSEALDEDGWLHTGDVGMWLPNGSLKIIDRKKHIFKLSQGEYIAPEKIEQVLVQSPAVAQVYVHGESLKASLVAIVIPDKEVFETWCAGKGAKGGYEDLCSRKKVNTLVLEDLESVGKMRGLKSFELPKAIHLSTEMFSVDNDMLTPTFKSRRPQIHDNYKDVIDQLYVGLD